MPLIGNIDDLKWNYDPEVSAAGRAPIARALLVGIDRAVRDLRALCESA